MLNEEVLQQLQSALVHHLHTSSFISTDEYDWRRALISYGEVISKAGLSIPARGISKHLTRIGDDCNPLPRLDVLVVNRRSGKPGKFFGDEASWQRQVQACIAQREKY